MRIVFSLLLILWNLTLSSQQSGFILIENKGQWHRDVLFKTDLKNGHLYTTKSGFVYDFYDEKKFKLSILELSLIFISRIVCGCNKILSKFFIFSKSTFFKVK